MVLLAMAVLATMMLSVVSRSVSEVAVTTREEESLRAFSAAEAGVEQALISGSQQDIIDMGIISVTDTLEVPSESGLSEVSRFDAEVVRYPEDPTKFAYPFELTSGQSASVWFVTRDGDTIEPCSPLNCFQGNELTLCYGDPTAAGPDPDPAIVASIIYEDAGSYGIAHIGFDSNANATRRDVGSGGTPPNNFEPSISAGATCTNVDGQNYKFQASVDFVSLNVVGTPILMRVSTLYNPSVPHVFGVVTSSPLPIQGRKVSSEGIAGQTTRKIDAFLLNPEMPFIYDAAIYSGGGITK